MTITKADLRKSIYQEIVNSEKLYYSFVNKSQQTLSMMKNERFLIFNQAKGHLFYINEPKTLPFATEIPQPKNNIIADMNLTSIIKGTSNEFNIQFVVNKEKNEMTEWNFVCENTSLSAAWVKLLTEYKEIKRNEPKINTTEVKKIEEPKKEQSPTKTDNNQNVKENPFKSDNLGYSNNTQNNEIMAKNIYGYGNTELSKAETKPLPNNSSINTNAINQTNILPPNQPLNESNVKNEQLGYSNLNYNNINQNAPLYDSKKQPNQPSYGSNTQSNQPAINIKEPINNSLANSQQSLPNSQLNNSNINPQPITSNIPRKPLIRPPSVQNLSENEPSQSELQESNKNSRLTFKDEIESMIAQSKLSQYGSNQSNIRQSTKSAYNRNKDWNWRFYSNPSENLICEFEEHSIESLKSIIQEDRKSKEALRVYLQSEELVIVANFGSVEAKKIKSEFRNYHFIMEAIKSQPYGETIGVPLTCLIEYEGLVAMVKSLIPEHAPKVECTQEVMLQIKELERYTRVKNAILKKATLYDLSNIYETTGKRLLFINQLIEYLPVHTDDLFYGSLLRSEHLLDNVNQFMHGGLGYEAMRHDLKIFEQVVEDIKKNTIQLAKEISCGDVKFTNGEELKNIMHERGINLKYLPLLYNETTNKQVKKYVHSFMVAKIAKEDILSHIISTRSDRVKSSKPEFHTKELIEKSIKLLVEGNSNVSNELWKEISVTFKKQYGLPISNSDIHGPFFLNSLMGLLKGKYDLTKCNMNKVMFRDEYIIGNGFIVEVGMKVKSYYRWMNQDLESLMEVCKSERRDEVEFMGVCEMLSLKKNPIPQELEMCRINSILEEYLSSFIPPPEFEPNEFEHLNLYHSLSLEPPTTHSLKITVNYLRWCLEYGHVQEFKMAIDEALQLIDLWLGAGNAQKGSVYQCEFYELLSEYYEQQGSVDDSINFLKESLSTIIRNNGLGSRKIGNEYYMLGEREMRAGRWNESLESFLKAKQSMEGSNNTQQLNYPKTLLKLSQLYLNSSQFENSLLYAKQSIEQFEKIESSLIKSSESYSKDLYDEFCLKSIEVMTRVFEIENKKNELHRMAQMTANKYHKTKNPKVFEQLIKITLTSIISKSSPEKGKLLLSLIEKTISPSIDAFSSNNLQLKDSSLQELMSLSSQSNVMERLMIKYETLERIITDINGKRAMGSETKEFINILKPIVNIVGEEFIFGLVEQREIEE